MKLPEIYFENFWIVLIIILPNILFLLFPPINTVINKERPPFWKIVLIFEKIGQISVFTLPFFFNLSLDTNLKKAALITMIITASLYYFCWMKYIYMGRQYELLFSNLLFIPVPMAVMPILYFAAVGITLSSKLMITSSIVLALGHIPESIISCQKSR